jgi:hypothetical protein
MSHALCRALRPDDCVVKKRKLKFGAGLDFISCVLCALKWFGGLGV